MIPSVHLQRPTGKLMYAKNLQAWLSESKISVKDLTESIEEFLANTPIDSRDDINSMLEYLDKETIVNFLKVLKK